MPWSIKLFSVRGIDIKMHLTFLLIVGWGAYNWGVGMNLGFPGAVYGAFLMILLFVCVVLHELGHSMAALYYGVQVRDIILLPIGGVARLQRMPEKPTQEFVVAIAGPAVNFLIILILLPILVPLLIWQTGQPGTLTTDPAAFAANVLMRPSITSLVFYLFVANLLLGVFNLLPAFPMDGGRILRALLAMVMEYTQATNIAVFIGRGFAIFLGLMAFFTVNIFLLLIAIFVYLGAGQEGEQVQVRSVLQHITARQALSRGQVALLPDDLVGRAVELTLSSYQTDFPVIQNGELVGILTRSDLVEALRSVGPEVPVSEVMHREYARCSVDAQLNEVREKMAESEMRVVALFEDDHFVGLLSMEDISEVFMLLSAVRSRQREQIQSGGKRSASVSRPT